MSKKKIVKIIIIVISTMLIIAAGIFAVIIISFAGYSSSVKHSEVDTYNGTFVASSGETVTVRIYVDDPEWLAKNFIELTDSAGLTVTYRIHVTNEKAIPQDYFSEDIDENLNLAWVRESDGSELIAYRTPDDRGFHKLISLNGHYIDLQLDNLKPYVSEIEESGFLDDLPDSAAKDEWRAFFDKVKTVNVQHE